jgi:hypothetical protein
MDYYFDFHFLPLFSACPMSPSRCDPEHPGGKVNKRNGKSRKFGLE